MSAYNSGSCESAKGLAYANQVLANTNAYEGGPEVSAWATGNYTGQTNNFLWWHWGMRQWQQPYPDAQTWTLVSEVTPFPMIRQGAVGAAPDSKSPPVTYSWRDVSPPTEVTINRQPARLDPPGAPLMPGQEVWGIQTDQTGTITATAEWKWQACSGNPPVCVWHQVYAASPAITILPAQQ